MKHHEHPIRSVCVYCGASERIDQRYKDIAIELGQALAKADITLVFGGGRVGLMGVISTACLQAGGRVIGIMPDFLYEREGTHENLTELHIVKTMHERKQKMFEYADAFVILPGGFGTLDEAFEIITWQQVGLHNKPIIWFNAFNYWLNLLNLQINHMIEEGFVQPKDYHIFDQAQSVSEIIKLLTHVPVSNKDQVTTLA